MSAIAARTQFLQPEPQSYYRRAVDGLRSIASRFSKGFSTASKATTQPVKKLLHMAPSLPTLQSLFYLGSEIDGSNHYTKQTIDPQLVRSMLPDDLEAKEILLRAAAARPRLEQLKIQSKTPSPIMDEFHFFSGIRTSAFYKLDGATEFARAGIPTLIGDYTGFGNSFGEAEVNSDTLLEDAKLKLQHSLDKNGSANALGHSLGSAIASRSIAELSNEHELRSCNFVSVSGWDNFETLATEAPWIGWKPFTPLVQSKVKTLIEGKFNTGDNLCKVIDNMVRTYQERAPQADEKFHLIIVHGTKDRHVSKNHADELSHKIESYIRNQVPQELQSHFKVDYLIEDAGHFTAKHRDGVIPWAKIISTLKAG